MYLFGEQPSINPAKQIYFSSLIHQQKRGFKPKFVSQKPQGEVRRPVLPVNSDFFLTPWTKPGLDIGFSWCRDRIGSYARNLDDSQLAISYHYGCTNVYTLNCIFKYREVCQTILATTPTLE
jgi:hypothetical protein